MNSGNWSAGPHSWVGACAIGRENMKDFVLKIKPNLLLLASGLVALTLLTAGCRADRPAAAAESAAATAPAAATPAVESATATPGEAPTTAPAPTAPEAPQRFNYQIVDEIDHDIRAFTQGLVYADGIFYEGTGLRGQSTLRKVDPETGEVLTGVRYPEQYFAEGVAVMGDRVFQLTWQSNIGFIFDSETLESAGQFTYPTEGWGLTHDGERLIMSDGTATLYFLDPETQKIVDQLPVQDDQGPVAMLNELEYIEGRIFANIWQTEQIAIIDPATGNVTGYIDLAGLPDEDARADLMAAYALENEEDLAAFLRTQGTLNGIAYDAENDRLFVTGKLWPEIYEIDLVPIKE
jgi:glutamine cyclotransferase